MRTYFNRYIIRKGFTFDGRIWSHNSHIWDQDIEQFVNNDGAPIVGVYIKLGDIRDKIILDPIKYQDIEFYIRRLNRETTRQENLIAEYVWSQKEMHQYRLKREICD